MKRRSGRKGIVVNSCYAPSAVESSVRLGRTADSHEVRADKLKRVGISTWSFHDLFTSTRDENAATSTHCYERKPHCADLLIVSDDPAPDSSSGISTGILTTLCEREMGLPLPFHFAAQFVM